MKRTSGAQLEMMVAFMEQHGDLSKTSTPPRDKIHSIHNLWEKLEAILNNDITGDTRTVDIWKRVWSDYKSNTKKKAAKINRAATSPSGGPGVRAKLTPLEERTLAIMGVQAATGLSCVHEAGFEVSAENEPVPVFVCTEREGGSAEPINFPLLDCEIEEHMEVALSPQPQMTPTSSTLNDTDEYTPHKSPSPTGAGRVPSRRRADKARGVKRGSNNRRVEQTAKHFLHNDEEWRRFKMEQHRDNIRLKEMELQNQRNWHALGNRFLDIVEKFLSQK